MRNDKQQALKLRLQGKSYTEINKLLGIPKGTLSDWFTGLELSEKAKDKIKLKVYEGSLKGLLKKNRLQTHRAQQNAGVIRNESAKKIGKLSQRDLLILGASLYWAEGYKRTIIKNGKERTYHPVSLSNSDPALIVIFLQFLRKVCRVDDSKIHAGLRIFQHHNDGQLLDFWSNLTKIPKERFEKFYYGVSKSSLGKRPFNILPYGTIQIRINSTNLYHEIMGYIKGLQIN